MKCQFEDSCSAEAVHWVACKSGCFRIAVCAEHSIEPSPTTVCNCGALLTREPIGKPRARPDYPYVTWAEPYDEAKYQVPVDRDGPVFKGIDSMKLGTEQCFVVLGDPNLIKWAPGTKQAVTVPVKDYKGRDILIPDERMWGWWMQRKITRFEVASDRSNGKTRVVFGTKEDRYTEYPEKYGFLSRRAISSVSDEWLFKEERYEERLKGLNPLRGESGGKSKFGVGKQQLQNRLDEISEESGLRIKHAPSILMIHRYIKTHDDFVRTYLCGSRGDDTEVKTTGPHRARPDHITDHEIYRLFSGKHRSRILADAMFADDTLKISQVGKKKNHWYTKNQIARLIRIKSELSVGKNEGQVQQIKQLLKTQRTEEQAPRVELMQGLGRSILKKVGKTGKT